MFQIRIVSLLLSMGLLIGCASATKNPEELSQAQAGADSAGQLDTSTELADSAADGQQKEVAKKDEMVCKTVKPTGSRISERHCRSRAEIEREKELSEDWVNKVQITTQSSSDGI